MKIGVKIVLFVTVFLVISCRIEGDELVDYTYLYEDQEEFSIGKYSVFEVGRSSYIRPIYDLEGVDKTYFNLGKSLFKASWVPSPASTTGLDGLGPTFNAKSCMACHDKNGRGMPTNLDSSNFLGLIKISIPGVSQIGGPVAVPNYGLQIQTSAILKLKAEGNVKLTYEIISRKYTDGTSYSLQKPTYTIFNTFFGALPSNTMISPRIGNQLIGLGFIDGLADKEILKNEDPFDTDKDSISGKANYVWNEAENEIQLGKFGWKASEPTLEQQVASAAIGDMGLTTPIFPHQNCPSPQNICKNLLNGNGNSFEIPKVKLDQLTMFESAVGVPVRRNFKDENVLKGKELFRELKCLSCHQIGFKVEESKLLPQINGTIINPYSDYLLHDMGEDLADSRSHFMATGNEWRTAPLWGIGLQEKINGHSFFLHDGRARSLEEAIIWHGGEALQSKNNFMSLSKAERTQVIAFLKSL